ncbi:MAG: hypothetical protein WBN40_02480, partial [Pseudomonadales bacterium]
MVFITSSAFFAAAEVLEAVFALAADLLGLALVAAVFELATLVWPLTGKRAAAFAAVFLAAAFFVAGLSADLGLAAFLTAVFFAAVCFAALA